MLKVNLGCGPETQPGWVNVDYAPGARLASTAVGRFAADKLPLFDVTWSSDIHLHDLRKPLPWPDDSVDFVYSSHTVEHFSREDGRRLLAESYRVLKPGGSARIIVPDLKATVDAYLAGSVRSDDFVEALGVLGVTATKRGIKRTLAPLIQFPHKCMYDTETLLAIFADLGFSASSRGAFDSAIPDIRDIEELDRTVDAVIVEGVKPARS